MAAVTRDTSHVTTAIDSRADAYVTFGLTEVPAAIRDRPSSVPWIAIGGATTPAPTIWLPRLPEPSLFAALLAPLMPQAASPWRRKADMIVGRSPAIRHLLQTLDRLAPVQTPVLITGESGVGKELVAQALHFASPRARSPFVAINCAAIPESLFEAEFFGYSRGAFTGATQSRQGAFESANGGTLFLDEIGEMPVNMQAKLLRVLQTGEVQRIGSTELRKVVFRLVSATNRDLQAAAKTGQFREDLYYRIQVYPVHVAPLRERLEDVPALAAHHLAVIAAREQRQMPRLTSAALEKLVGYRWPGNVRELLNVIERAVLLAGEDAIDAVHVVLPDDAVDAVSSLPSFSEAKARFERDYYTQLLRAAGGNVSLASKLGKKTRKEIYDALKKLGLDAETYRTGDVSAATAPRRTPPRTGRPGRMPRSERS